MTIRRKVVAARDSAIGMVHPSDGPLSREGSEWTLDAFTQRRIHDGSIAHYERPSVETQPAGVETQAPVVTKPAAKVTTAAPKIQTR